MKFRLEIGRACELASVVEALGNIRRISKGAGTNARAKARLDALTPGQARQLMWDLMTIAETFWPLITAPVEVEAEVKPCA